MRSLCIICTDLFDNFNDVIAVPCGHVFHSKCLFHWLDQSKTCPECRRSVTLKSVIKLYFNTSSNYSTSDISGLANEIESLKAEIREKQREIEKGKNKHKELTSYITKYELEIESLQQIQHSQEMEVRSLKTRVESLKHMDSKCQKLTQKVVALSNDIELLNNVQQIVNGTQEDVDNMLRDMNVVFKDSECEDAAKKIATYCSIIKRELKRVIDKNISYKIEVTDLKKKFGITSQTLKHEKLKNQKLEIKISDLEKDNLKLSMKENNQSATDKATLNSSFKSPIPCTSKAVTEDFVMTPITVNFDNKKRKMDLVVLDNKVCKIQVAGQHAGMPLKSANLKKYSQADSSDSILKIGYNGFGGHGRFIKNSKSASRP